MAKSKSREKDIASGSAFGPAIQPFQGDAEHTGKFLVLFAEDGLDEGMRELSRMEGINLLHSRDNLGENLKDESNGIVFDDLGIAVMNTDPNTIKTISTMSYGGGSPVVAVEPERYVYAIADVPSSRGPIGGLDPSSNVAEYLRGYKDAVDHLVATLLGVAGTGAATLSLADEAAQTWGLMATKVAASTYTGRGVRVGVLDTGIDLNHSDFIGRHIESRSFIEGENVQDSNGHGTHCIGTACGPSRPSVLPRYGIAWEADIYVGKVLSNAGRGTDTSILSGITWAMTNDCTVVSMSLGAATSPGQSHSQIYERLARRALDRGMLIVAAAGNDSRRPSMISPVSHPANCPSIIAVAALDSSLNVASFSNQGINPQGGQIDIAGPGVDVRSAWPSPAMYRTISGTSMATPHVAGIAALFAEAYPAARGRELLSLITQNALRLPLSGLDVGAGLVQAP